MNEGMDTGDMILKEEVKIGDDETTGELWSRLAEVGANLLVKTLKLIEAGKAPRKKQGEDFTLAPMLDKSMAEIDWKNKTAAEIKNLVRGDVYKRQAIDATYGRKTRAVIIMDSGHVILSSIQPETVAGRLEKDEDRCV